MINIEPRVWFIDANVAAHWALSKGGVLESISAYFSLDSSFVDNYNSRYSESADFIQMILSSSSDISDEFFISSLALNELFAAVRDELRSVMFFLHGVPLSLWRNPWQNPQVSPEAYRETYVSLMESLDKLFGSKGLNLIEELTPSSMKNYLEVYSSVLFLIKQMKTQDAILLTTAILKGSDYFITLDKALRGNAKRTLNTNYEMQILNAGEAMIELKKRYPSDNV